MFRQINTNDYELSKVQDNVAVAFNDLDRESPILNGVFVSVLIGTTDTAVNHQLRRALVGWIIVGRNAAATVYESATHNLRPKDQIILNATAPVTAKIYFF